MHFHFTTVNQHEDGDGSLLDPRNSLAGMLVDMGHVVSRSNNELRTRPSINVIFEGFGPDTVGWMRTCVENGCDFIVVCTEEFGEISLNDAPHPDMKVRQYCLPSALKLAKAVWCLVPGTAEKAKEYCAESYDIELGWSEFREKNLSFKKVEPENDFSFYGGVLQRRGLVLNSFKARGHKVVVPDVQYGGLEQRDDVVRSAKVTLGLKPVQDWKIVSSSRAQTSLHLGRPAIFEDVDERVRSPWRDVVPFYGPTDFGPAAEEMVLNWREEAAKQVERFRDIMHPKRIFAHALEPFN